MYAVCSESKWRETRTIIAKKQENVSLVISAFVNVPFVTRIIYITIYTGAKVLPISNWNPILICIGYVNSLVKLSIILFEHLKILIRLSILFVKSLMRL